MVCDALRDLGVQCVTPECLRLAKVEDHSSSVPRLYSSAAPRLPVPVRLPARPPRLEMQLVYRGWPHLPGSRS